MNNDFFVTREAIRQWLPNRLTRDKKIVIHGNSYIILYISNDPGTTKLSNKIVRQVA